MDSCRIISSVKSRMRKSRTSGSVRGTPSNWCVYSTMKYPLQKEKVYDEVSQKLDEYNFWHSNIKVSTDVNIPL